MFPDDLWELQVMEKINNPHYLYRMTVLVAISLLAPVVGAEPTCQTMLPVVINAAKDRCTPYVFIVHVIVVISLLYTAMESF